MSIAPVEFKYSEELLASHLGISRSILRSFRLQRLEADLDWQKNGDGFVALSDSGVAKIFEALGRPTDVDLAKCLIDTEFAQTPLADRDGEGQKSAASLQKNGAVKMTVTKIPLNRRMILAVGERVKECLVEVGRNENFVVGDEIEAMPYSSQHGIWRLVGAAPRSRRRIGGRSV